jgi:flavodoxin
LEAFYMKFKMRVLHFSPAGNAEKLADAIARKQQCNADNIPPAYPCENEKLLFIGVELKGSKPDKSVEALCRDLNPTRAKNVAFFAVGSSFEGIAPLKKLVTAAGLNAVDSVFECNVKSGLFSKGKVTDADVKAAVDWADKLVNSL